MSRLIKSKRIFIHFNKALCLFLCLFPFWACQNDLYEKGEKTLAIGDFKRAASFFSSVLDEDPLGMKARYGLALSYFGLAEEMEWRGENALSFWQKAYDEFRILERARVLDGYEKMYSTCLFYWARATLSLDPEASVLSVLDRSIELDSTNYFSFNLKGLFLQSKGQDSLAQETFVYIIAKEPEFIAAYSNLGNLYWKKGDYENAWDIWSMGLQKYPNDPYLKTWTERAQDSLTVRFLMESL
jgi:tetratricopeptide (TPR) repeat protein